MVYSAYPLHQPLVIREMYSLFVQDYEKDYVFPGESHNFWEGIYLLKGKICASGDQHVYNLAQGDIHFHAPLEFHQFYIDDPNGAKLFIFSFSADGMPLEFLKQTVFRLGDAQKGIIRHWLRYVSEKSDHFAAFRGITDGLEAIRTHGSYGQMLSCYLAQLILTLGDDGVIAAATQTPETAIFSKAVVYMNQQVCRNPSVSAIAAHCNISETGLKRIFTKYAGIGIHKYFMHLKFKAAAALLKEGMGVTETAEKLGFSDQGYFSKAFKRELGVSPSALKGQKGSAV